MDDAAKKIVAEFEAIFGDLPLTERTWLEQHISDARANAIAYRASSMPLVSDETRPAVEIARQMLAMGINVQATGEVTNQVVAGIIKSLLDHIDELEADLKCAVAVGRYAARTPSPQGTDQPTLPMAPGADHG
jgi:hypothetical protein